MITYALDTNIVSFILKGNDALKERIVLEGARGNMVIVPPVTYYEIRRWLIFSNAVKRAAQFDDLCLSAPVAGMEKTAFEIAAVEHARLKKSGYNLDDADLLIAGFCVSNGYVLVTNNKKHFDLIEGLVSVDWLADNSH
jgi:predicted nucleic acid-binding protein